MPRDAACIQSTLRYAGIPPSQPKKSAPLYGNRWASGTPSSAVPPLLPAAGVPQQREARIGAPPRRGTPFVARHAVNLHGCAPASLCPPFFLRRGYPRECSSSGSGAPPPAATPPDPLASPATQATEGFAVGDTLSLISQQTKNVPPDRRRLLMRCRRSATVSGTLLVQPGEDGIECPAPAPSGKECPTPTTHKPASQGAGASL